jgi:hypothetical protein
MMFVARKIIEQLVEHQKQVAASPEVVADEAMPGYRSYVSAMREQAAPPPQEPASSTGQGARRGPAE